MSRRLSDKYRQRLAAESGATPVPWGGRLAVALVYPNTYHQGMSNLGMQAVYSLLNRRDDTRCERIFLPDPEDLKEHRRTGAPLLSLETQRPLTDFDLIAFSISFENDLLNLPAVFELAQLPLWRNERDSHYPLVLCGGVCAFLNPEPLADIMDLFAVGEAEAILPGLLAALQAAGQSGRDQLLPQLAKVPGMYVPGCYSVAYEESGLPHYSAQGDAPTRVARRWLADLDAGQAMTVVHTPDTEFGDMTLVEVSRGCPRACRFCAAGFIYRPFREHSLAQLQRVACDDSAAKRIGLVGAAVTDYGGLAELGRSVLERGGEVSVSSVRIDAITPEQVTVLAESGHRTLALAPEAGSQRLRDVINKGIDEAQILAAVEMISDGEIPNLKLYFMIGLPGETPEDIDAIIELVARIRDVWQASGRRQGRLGQLVLSVNPFIPKPWTPLQWAPMEKTASLEKKYQLLRRRVRPLPNVSLHCESLRAAELQGFLARGDRRVGRDLPLLAAGMSLKSACRQAGLDASFYLHRDREAGESFPWEVIDQGIARDYLYHEYLQALAARPGWSCHPGCRRCGMVC